MITGDVYSLKDRHGSQVEQGLKESLQKLNLTYVDLYLMHFPVDQTRPAPFRFDPVEVSYFALPHLSPS